MCVYALCMCVCFLCVFLYISLPQGKTLLSSMLHRENEAYDDDALAWWAKLKGVFGESQSLR